MIRNNDAFRLNFSFGSQDGHANVHAAIRALEREVEPLICILMGGLQAPRLGLLRVGKTTIEIGEAIRFVGWRTDGDRTAIPLSAVKQQRR